MKMYEVEVSIIDGNIYITQDTNPGEDQNTVIISADQADIVADWIKGAAASLRKTEE